MPKSPDTIIDELGEHDLRALCSRYLYEPSDHDWRLEALRLTVRDAYEDGMISAGAIRALADDKSPRLAAANRIIAEQNRKIAKACAVITDLAGIEQSQFLIGALLRDDREAA